MRFTYFCSPTPGFVIIIYPFLSFNLTPLIQTLKALFCLILKPFFDQVVSLQAQLASMKEQAAAQSLFPSGSAFANPNGKLPNSQAPYSAAWFDELENKQTLHHLDSVNLAANYSACHGNGVISSASPNSAKIPDESAVSYGSSFEEVSCFDMQMDSRQWISFQDADQLDSIHGFHLY